MLTRGLEYRNHPLLFNRVCRLCTPLIYAAYRGHIDICYLLVECGADLTASGRCPKSSLPILVRVESVFWLELSCRGTALQIAIKNKRDEVVVYLRRIGAPERSVTCDV